MKTLLDNELALILTTIAFCVLLLFVYHVVTQVTRTPADLCLDAIGTLSNEGDEDNSTKTEIFIECMKTQRL